MAGLSIRAGIAAYNQDTRPNKWLIFAAIFLGVLFHWIYEVVVAGLKNKGAYDFGSPGMIAGHIFVSLVASIPAYLSAFAQLSQLGDDVRYASAFVAGLGVDALVAPWTVSTPATPG